MAFRGEVAYMHAPADRLIYGVECQHCRKRMTGIMADITCAQFLCQTQDTWAIMLSQWLTCQSSASGAGLT